MSELDICSVCGEPVKRKNLFHHYEKVHPKHLSSLLRPKLETKLSKRRRIRRPRRIVFYTLVAVSIVLVSVAAAEVVSNNTIRMHIHPQLSILILGASEPLPANIGIARSLWKEHSLDHYGVNGVSPLLTRDTSGVVHIESNTVTNFTLHEFLNVWGKSMNDNEVVGNSVQPNQYACILVNGQAVPPTTDIVFVDQQKIVLEIINQSCSAVG